MKQLIRDCGILLTIFILASVITNFYTTNTAVPDSAVLGLFDDTATQKYVVAEVAAQVAKLRANSESCKVHHIASNGNKIMVDVSLGTARHIYILTHKNGKIIKME